MTVYNSSFGKVQIEQTSQKSPISEGTIKQVAAAVNYYLQNIEKATIGQIEYSLLNLTQFQAEKGTGWVLANGQPVPDSAYAALIGGSVPDMRGRFLRMKDHGAGRDKTGERSLGDLENNAVLSHNHPASFIDTLSQHGLATDNVKNINTGGGGQPKTTGYPAFVSSYNFLIDHTGDVETRPRNITVNVFIKIN